MKKISNDFAEGVFWAMCQRCPTNREVAFFVENAASRGDLVRMVRDRPEAKVFSDMFHGLSFNWLTLEFAVGEAPSPIQADLLVDSGITRFVSLAGEFPYQEDLPDEVLCDVRDLVNDDYNDPGIIRAAAEGILGYLGSAERVYLHCMSGMSRSIVVASVVTAVRLGLSYAEALDAVRSRRPVASPHRRVVSPEAAEDIVRGMVDVQG